MSGKVEATFHGAEPDPQTAQQLAVARAYVARVDECPYQHTHTSLYCSKCGWFAESPIPALVAEVDRCSNELAAVTPYNLGGSLASGPVVREDPEGLDQHYTRATDPRTNLGVYVDHYNGRNIPEYEAALKVRAKRLSEAEMAAELYRAEWTVLRHKIDSHERDPFYKTCEFGRIRPDDRAKVATIQRFATHPHHDAA